MIYLRIILDKNRNIQRGSKSVTFDTVMYMSTVAFPEIFQFYQTRPSMLLSIV